MTYPSLFVSDCSYLRHLFTVEKQPISTSSYLDSCCSCDYSFQIDLNWFEPSRTDRNGSNRLEKTRINPKPYSLFARSQFEKDFQACLKLKIQKENFVSRESTESAILDSLLFTYIRTYISVYVLLCIYSYLFKTHDFLHSILIILSANTYFLKNKNAYF